MADIRISQLPAAPSVITGTELVPIVQNGLTVQTTVSAITQSPSLTQSFLTVGAQPLLPNSRYFSAGTGLGITDGGAQGPYIISLNGTAYSLELAGTGVIVKTAANTIAARNLVASGNGLGVTNGSGISGNPTFALTGLAQALANASGAGLLALGSSSTISPVTITGTSNQIGVTGGDGSSTPTISLAANLIAPGTAGLTLPNGTTAQRAPVTGQIRYNTTLARFEGYYAGTWQTFGIGDGGLTSVSGTTSQIDVSNVGSIATVALATNLIVPGAGGVTLPVGTTAQRTTPPVNGILRYNTTTATFEGYSNGAWGSIISGSGVTSVATGTGLTGGPITSAGTIAIANTAVTAAAYGSSYQVANFTVNAQGQLTFAANTTIDAVTLTTGSITTTPVNVNDIANKNYVDSVAQGLDAKASCVAATTANITLSGTQTIDGIALVASDRCLVKNQTLSQDNGIYIVSASAWTRAPDMNVWAEVPSSFTFIEQGTTQSDTGWVTTANAGGTLGTTPIPWSQFSGAGTYTAGTGLTLAGTQFSVTNTAVTAAAYGSASQVATFTTNAQGQLTAAASVAIAIAASQVTSGVLAVAQGGTGVASSTGTTSVVLSNSPTLVTPALGTPSSAVLTNATGLPVSTGVAGLGTGVATALAVNVGTAGAPVVNGGALGVPSSGTVTNLTGTASINVNGTVGATTPAAGAFTSVTASTTLGVTGVSTLTAGAVVQGMTVGRGAGAIASNTVVGSSALGSNTTGVNNTVVGASSLQSNTTGEGNTATGVIALQNNTTGVNNTANGLAALNQNTTGSGNTASGVVALQINTAGYSNTASGFAALQNNTTGGNNTALGYGTGLGITTGSGNTVLGANVTGLAAALTNNIILSDGNGAIKAQHNGTYWAFTGPIRASGYTVATLPAGVQGMRAFVTDSLAPAYLAMAVGGGSIVAPVFYNGTNWVTA